MKRSSKSHMNQVFKLLGDIKTAEIDDRVYDNILKGLERSKQISIVWVRAAAVGLFLLSAGSLYLIQYDTINNPIADINEVVPNSNNDIYSYE